MNGTGRVVHNFTGDLELVAHLVALHGGLGEYVHAEPSTYAFLNHVWRVETDSGLHFMKRHVVAVKEDRLAWTARFLDRIASTGFPSDRIVATAAGAPSLEVGGHQYTAHTALQGTCLRGGVAALTRGQRSQAIAGMARFHAASAATDSLDAPPQLHPSGLGGPDPSILLFQEDPAILRLLVSRAVEDLPIPDEPVIKSAVRQVEEFLSGAEYARIPKLVAHGDLRPKNMVFSGDQLGGLFDWDFIQRMPRLVDVCGRFAEYFILSASDVGQSTFLANYLHAYSEAAAENGLPLSAEEEVAVPYFLRAGVIQTGVIVSHFIKAVRLGPGESEASRAKESARRLASAVAQIRILADLAPVS
jgi:Ser/Thr protein kinase RdoA (MazF antagonist)